MKTRVLLGHWPIQRPRGQPPPPQPPALDDSMHGNPTLCRHPRLSSIRKHPHLQTVLQDTPPPKVSEAGRSPPPRRSPLQPTGSPIPVVSSGPSEVRQALHRVGELIGSHRIPGSGPSSVCQDAARLGGRFLARAPRVCSLSSATTSP